jgi:hypothetical protein
VTALIPGNCSGYNDYKFGPGNRNTCASQVTEAEILSEYPRREVTHLLGANDTDMTDPTRGAHGDPGCSCRTAY